MRPSCKRPSRIQAPKNLSTKHRLTIQLRGAFCRASNLRQASEETVDRSSTRFPAPGGVHHRASKPHPSSEEPVSDSSTRICSSRNLIILSCDRVWRPKTPSATSRIESELPKNTSTNARLASGFRGTLQQNVVSLPRTQGPLWQAVRLLLNSEEFV